MNTDPIKNASLEDLKLLLAKGNELLTSFTFAVHNVVPELVRRLEEPLKLEEIVAWIEKCDNVADINAIDDATCAWELANGSSPPAPIPIPDPDPDLFESAADHYDADKFDSAKGVHIDATMTEAQVAYLLTDAVEDGEPLRVFVKGEVPRITLGGTTKHAVTRLDGQPIHDIEFVGVASSLGGGTIYGLKFDGGVGGINGEVRLSGDLTVCPARNADGSGMGDKASIATLVEMPNLKLVITPGVDCAVPHDWTAYDGMGYKWAVFLSGCTLIVDAEPGMAFASPAREHTFYIKNMRFSFVENASNDVRIHVDALGVQRVVGNGRTFGQHSNRVHDVYPKGGAPSAGRIVFRGCVAYRCGWEGLMATEKDDGGVNLGGKAGGGSDFTCHGHTGDSFELIECESNESYCGSVAVWNEVSNSKKADNNPLGIRSWMIRGSGDDPVIYDPFSGVTEESWATSLVAIIGFEVFGKRAPNQRTPFLVSGTRTFHADGLVLDGETVLVGSEHLRLDHQKGATPIEQVVVIA